MQSDISPRFPTQEQIAEATRSAFARLMKPFKDYIDGKGRVPGVVAFDEIRRKLKELVEPENTTADHASIEHLDWPLREYLTQLVVRSRLLWYPSDGIGNGPGLQDKYRLTLYGYECFQARTDSLPIDKNHVLPEARKRLPSIDDTTLKYLEEGCTAISFGLFLSSAVCLGCASENEILNLVDLYAAGNVSLQEKFKAKLHISEKVKILLKSLRDNQAPKDEVDGLERMENLTRETRNAAGHPKIPKERESRVRLLYEEFLQYIENLNRLRDWIKKENHN